MTAIDKNNNKFFKVFNVKFHQFQKVFTLKYQGKVIYLSDGNYMTQMGHCVPGPDSIMYTVNAEIEDSDGNLFLCTLFNKTAEKLFGVSAEKLWQQTEKLQVHNDNNYENQLIALLNELQVDLIIQSHVKVFKSIEGTPKKMIGWNVHHLEPSDIESSSVLT